MLSEVALPPTAPHPKVKAGASPVVAPTPPKAPGVFTKIRDTGFFNANSFTTSLLFVWRVMVWPAPSF